MLKTATTWITWDFNQQRMRNIWKTTSKNKQHVTDLVILFAVQCVFFGKWFHHLRSTAAERPSEAPRQVREFCAALVHHRSRGASHGLNTQVGSRLECLQANVQGQADRSIKVNEFLKIEVPQKHGILKWWHIFIGWFRMVFFMASETFLWHVALASSCYVGASQDRREAVCAGLWGGHHGRHGLYHQLANPGWHKYGHKPFP